METKKYKVFYKDKEMIVDALSPYHAQKIACQIWRVKYPWQIAWLKVDEQSEINIRMM